MQLVCSLIRLELTVQVKKMANASKNHLSELTQMSQVTEMNFIADTHNL